MFGSEMDVVKAEKERAMLRYRRLRRAAALSRCLLELLAALSLLSWSSARLPAAVTLCAGLRHLPAVLLHPLSAFLLGNVIIVTLVAKSSEASAATPPSSPSSTAMPPSSGAHEDLHRRYISAASPAHQHSHQAEEAVVPCVVYEDKAVCTQSLSEATAAPRPKQGRAEGPCFQRTRSADVAGALVKGTEDKLLRRSQSEAGVGAEEKAVAKRWEEGEEEDDSEEFRQKIEAFIARQMRFIEREEESLLLAAKTASSAATAGALRIAAAGQEHNRR